MPMSDGGMNVTASTRLLGGANGDRTLTQTIFVLAIFSKSC